MSNYSDIKGSITYDNIDDGSIEIIKDFIGNGGLEGKIYELSGDLSETSLSIAPNVTKNSIDFDIQEVIVSSIKKEIEAIVWFIKSLSGENIKVDITVIRYDKHEKTENYKLYDEKVVYSPAKIVYEFNDYS